MFLASVQESIFLNSVTGGAESSSRYTLVLSDEISINTTPDRPQFCKFYDIIDDWFIVYII